MSLKVNVIGKSARGLVRKDNQDSVLCLRQKSVFAVADGMGGGAEGALASRMVCEELERGMVSKDYLARLTEIESSITAANERIFHYAKSMDYKQMGSTVALLALDVTSGTRAAIGYIGDSRVYRLRAGIVELLTRDHSVGAELEAKIGAGFGSKFALRSNPLAHVLTRAIGTEPKAVLEWRKIEVADGDRYVICSDGVHDVIATSEMDELLAGDLSRASETLERQITARGAPDNYSFIIVDIGGRS